MEKLKLIILSWIFLMAISCESYLDRPPLDKIGTESYWKTTQDLQNYMRHFYPGLPTHGHTSGNQLSKEDDRSDNLIISSPNDILDGNEPVTGGTWIGSFDDIRSINIFFSNYSNCEDEFDQYQQYVGEAHFFRAWLYFNLVKQYGDVPWLNKPLYPESEELMKGRDPRTQVVDSILADLDKATEYLNTIADVEGGNNSVTKEAALAFKTRVALFEGTWQKYHSGTPFATSGANPNKYFQACIDAAEELQNGDYRVGIYNTGNPEEDYYTLFGLGDMSDVDEVLFYRAYNVADGVGHNAVNYATLHAGYMGLTWSFVTSFLDKDGNPYDYMGLAQTSKGSDFLTAIATDCDPRLHADVWVPGDLQIAETGQTFTLPPLTEAGDFLCTTGFQYRKYSNPNAAIQAITGTAFQSDNGYIYLRYAEVLLNYAEAKYELDGTVAYDALNQLRARAGMPDFTVNPQSADPNLVDYGYTISDDLYEIRRERRVETGLEAMREWDWKRWAAHALFTGKRPKGYPFKQDEFPNFTPDLDENGLIDYFAGSMPDGYQFRPGQDYLDDIPQTELVLNPNLTQNPGWPTP